jgi:TonB family protein
VIKVFATAVLSLSLLLAPSAAVSWEKHLIPAEQTATHIVRWVKPVYPSLARTTHLQGLVIVQASISKAGVVTDVKARSGHPILIQAALDAVRRWRFSPFLAEGKPVSVEALVTVQFPPGDSPAEIKEDKETVDRFFSAIDNCRDQMQDGNLADAERFCKNAIVLAGGLDPHRQMERMDAYLKTGHALFLQKKFAEALENYQKELQIATNAIEPSGAELAAAHQHVGNALWATGRKEEARVEYEQAENVFQQAYQAAESAFLRNQYARNLKALMRDHATLLRQMGQNDEAEFLEKQAAAIVVESGRSD